MVYETVDHETIVVNLDTGSYYDLNESAGYVFSLLAASATGDEVAARAASRYGLEAAAAESAVDELLGKLIEEQLVAPANDGEPAASPVDDGPPRPYAAPVINKYTDMQELLLLDPVHEVDESGWPSRA